LAYATLIVLALTFGLGDIDATNPYTSSLQYLIRALVPAIILLAVLASVARRQWPAFPSALAWPTAAWLAILTLSAALAPTDRLQALATLERPASGALLLWAVSSLARDGQRWRGLALATGIGGLVVALVGLAEGSGQPVLKAWSAALHGGAVPIGDVPRISGTLSHPNMAAMTFELSLPFVVAWAWTARGRWCLVAAGFGLATGLALLLTFSRAGIASGVAAIGLMMVLGRGRGTRLPVTTIATAAVVSSLVLAWTSVADPGLGRRLTAGLNESSSTQPSRLVFWSAAIDMARQNPWLGVGPDNYRLRFADYAGIDADNLGVHAHDQYLETLADTGLFGLLGLVWLLAALLRSAVMVARSGSIWLDWPWRLAVLASLSTWLLHAALDDFERFWPTSVAFWLVAGLCVGPLRRQPMESAEQHLGCVAFANKRADTRAQDFVPLLAASAQDYHLTGRADVAQAGKHAAGMEAG
jgi:O-antigen ligase